MGPIQSGINQSLAILSLASSQDPTAQAIRKNTAETKLGKHTVKASDRYYQGAQESVKEGSFGEAPSVEMRKPEAAKEAFELKQKGLNQQLEAAKERGDYKSIESLNKQIADLEENKFMYGLDEEEEQDPSSEDENEFYANEAAKELDKRISNKKRIKANMDMMKNALKEDN